MEVGEPLHNCDNVIAAIRIQRERRGLGMRWNPAEGGPMFHRVSDERLSQVRHQLASAGVDVTIRDTQGQDIDAACGQLRPAQRSPDPIS